MKRAKVILFYIFLSFSALAENIKTSVELNLVFDSLNGWECWFGDVSLYSKKCSIYDITDSLMSDLKLTLENRKKIFRNKLRYFNAEVELSYASITIDDRNMLLAEEHLISLGNLMYFLQSYSCQDLYIFFDKLNVVNTNLILNEINYFKGLKLLYIRFYLEQKSQFDFELYNPELETIVLDYTNTTDSLIYLNLNSQMFSHLSQLNSLTVTSEIYNNEICLNTDNWGFTNIQNIEIKMFSVDTSINELVINSPYLQRISIKSKELPPLLFDTPYIEIEQINRDLFTRDKFNSFRDKLPPGITRLSLPYFIEETSGFAEFSNLEYLEVYHPTYCFIEDSIIAKDLKTLKLTSYGFLNFDSDSGFKVHPIAKYNLMGVGLNPFDSSNFSINENDRNKFDSWKKCILNTPIDTLIIDIQYLYLFDLEELKLLREHTFVKYIRPVVFPGKFVYQDIDLLYQMETQVSSSNIQFIKENFTDLKYFQSIKNE
ncbi:hypothetical protein GYB22_09410 [bacterium]|nr:hypothetical protein [bacterium]